MRDVLSFALVLACSLLGCASPTGSDVDGGGTGVIPEGGVCSPGMTKSCACLGSTTSGMRTCDDKGQYGDCAPCSMGGSTGKPGDSTTTGTTGKCGTCNGCCSGSTCVPFADQGDDKCGGKGKNCAPCSGTTTCDTDVGKCLSAGSCGGGCTGCCTSTGSCVPYEESFWDTCGSNGSACVTCPIEGAFCNDAGKCTNQVSPYEYYEISIRSINESGNGCSSYSATGESNPDPYVCVYAFDPATKQVLTDFNGMPQKGCSDHCNSMGSCMLTVTQGILRRSGDNEPAQFDGAALIAGQLFLEAWDYDYGSSDLVGQGTFPKVTVLSPQAVQSAGPYSSGSSGCSVPVSFQLAYVF